MSDATGRSPLFALASMAADRERIECGDPRGRPQQRPIPDRDRLAPGGGRRQAAAPVVAIAAAQVTRAGRRSTWCAAASPANSSTSARCTTTTSSTRPTPAAAWRRERQVGQPAGDPRRRLPPAQGVGDRRLDRHRGRRPAGPHDRLALRGRDRTTAARLRRRPAGGQLLRVDQGRRRRSTARRHASAASSPASTGRPSRRSRRGATPSGWSSRSSTTSSTSPTAPSSSASRPATTWWKACTRCPCCAPSPWRAASARSWVAARTPAQIAERDKALATCRQRGRRERRGDRPPVRRHRRGRL